MANGQGNVPMKDPVVAGDGQTYNSHIDFPDFTVTLSNGTTFTGKPLLPNVSWAEQIGTNPLTEAQILLIQAGENWLRQFVINDTAPAQNAQNTLVQAMAKQKADADTNAKAVNDAYTAWQAVGKVYTFDQDLYKQMIDFREQAVARYDAQFSYVPIGLDPGQ